VAVSAFGSLYVCDLVTMSEACQTPEESQTRVWFLDLQEFGTLQVTKLIDSWLHDTDKKFGFNLPFLFKKY